MDPVRVWYICGIGEFSVGDNLFGPVRGGKGHCSALLPCYVWTVFFFQLALKLA